MNRILFTADTHFGHANILKHMPDRPYAADGMIKEHDEWLLDTDTGSLQAKMESKESFHFSDISCLSLSNIFDLNIWNLSDQAREQAESIIADALSKSLILRYEDRDAYYFSVATSSSDNKICKWAVNDYESYLRGEHRYL